MSMAAVDYDGLIPNNVGLGQDVRVKRALEKWHPGYIGWWMDIKELLQKEVDFVSVKYVSPIIEKYIHNDKVLIYEA